jgi:hypothetical protein
MKTILATIFIFLLGAIISPQIAQADSWQESEIQLSNVYQELNLELKQNKQFRTLLKKGRKNLKSRDEAIIIFKSILDSHNEKYGEVFSGSIISFHIFVYGVTQGVDTSGPILRSFGPGIGFSKGYELNACLLKSDYNNFNNIGVTATTVIGGGITTGIYFGTSGVCIRLGVMLGLQTSLSIDSYTTDF